MEIVIRAGGFDEFGQSRLKQFWAAQHLHRKVNSGLKGQGWLLPPPSLDRFPAVEFREPPLEKSPLPACNLTPLLFAGCKTPANQETVKYEPAQVSLTGKILEGTFLGPPKYESVLKADEPEVYWILYLSKPIDVRADPNELSPAETNFQRLQLVLEAGVDEKYQAFLNQTAQVTGTLFHQLTVHHKTTVLIEVEKIKPVK